MSEHTPSPWTVGIHGLTVDAVHPVRNDATGTTPLAFMSGYFGRDQQGANARLIAAAPEMLAALEGIVNDDSKYVSLADQRSRWNERMAAARAALAKALGRNAPAPGESDEPAP